MIGVWHQRVKVAVDFLFGFSSFVVLENDCLFFLLNFKQSPSLLDSNISLLAFTSDETVGLFEMFTERVVSVDNCETAGVPTDFTVLGVPVPKRLGNEEVVVFELSSEGGRWNVEEGVSSVEVMEISGNLVAGNFPGWMFSVGMELMFEISPGFIESLDGVVVWFLTHGDD